METVTIPVNEYNKLVNRAKLVDNEVFRYIRDLLSDDDFYYKMTALHSIFKNIGNERLDYIIDNGISTINGKQLTIDEFRKDIDEAKKEVENGDYITLDDFIKEMNDE